MDKQEHYIMILVVLKTISNVDTNLIKLNRNLN